MRRHALGLALVGAAVLVAASAAVFGWRVAGQPAARPLAGHETLTLTATGASYFSPTRLAEVTHAALTETDTITAVPSPGYPGIAVWDVRESVSDAANHQQLEPMSRTVAFDRSTAELVNCCGGNINGDGLIWQNGIAGYAFPVGTRKQTYDVFDTVLDQPEPVAYSGTDAVDGIAVYRFAEDIPATKAGFSALSSTDPQFYTLQRVYWVDPETGMLLKVTENEDLALVNPATGVTVSRLFHADLRTTPGTVARLASQDVSERNQITLLADIGLALFAAAGALAVAGGGLLVRRPGLGWVGLGWVRLGWVRRRLGAARSPDQVTSRPSVELPSRSPEELPSPVLDDQ